jgi:hypothetical protein
VTSRMLVQLALAGAAATAALVLPSTSIAASPSPSPVQRIIAQETGRHGDPRIFGTQPVVRSPDTIDAALAASSGIPVAPDFVDRNDRAHFSRSPIEAPVLPISDGRSPDTVDAALAASSGIPLASAPVDQNDRAHFGRSPIAATQPVQKQIIVTASNGFDWTDAGIGAAGGFALALLLLGGLIVAQRGEHRRIAT